MDRLQHEEMERDLMALKLENINNLIADDLAKRNDNWTEIDNTFELKADKSTTYTKTEVDTSLGLKANKQQEAWITPTLLNGWNDQGFVYSTVQYMKDDFGFVHIKGYVTGGTTDDVFVLPIGYRPPRAVRQICSGINGTSSSPATTAVVQITAIDGFVQRRSNSAGIFFDEIIFKAV